MILWLAGAVSLAMDFVIVSLAVMAAVCRLRRPRAADRPALLRNEALSGPLLVLQRAARGAGVVAAGALLLSGQFGIAIPPLWAHCTALGALFGFLLLAQYQQVSAVVLCLRGQPAVVIVPLYLRLWRLTEIAPAPIALVLLASGFELAAGRYSPRAGWLCVLVLAFGFLFFDGILGFTPLTRSLKKEALRAVESGEEGDFRKLVLGLPVNATLLAHYSSFPLLFLFGWLKPPLSNPLASPIALLEQAGGKPLSILGLIAVSGVIVIGLRWHTLTREDKRFRL
jgi:hypothetical protein